MYMFRKIFTFVGSILLLIIVFNRVSPLALSAQEKEEVSDISEKVESLLTQIDLPGEMGMISARPIENGQWLVFVDDYDKLLEAAFNEFGMLSCRPEFDLFVKSNLREAAPHIDLKESLKSISADCSGEYEIGVVGKQYADKLMEIFKDLYISEEHLISVVSEFKRQLKRCRDSGGHTDAIVCEEFSKKPLPQPEPLVLYINEEGEDVPLKGFSECYYRYLNDHSGGDTAGLDKAAKEACYSSW